MTTLATPPQWRVNLNKANEIRLARATVKRRLFASSRRESWAACAEIVADPPEVIGDMKVRELIAACRGLGPVKAREMLNRTRVGGSFTVGSLTRRQRHALCVLLRFGSMTSQPDVRHILSDADPADISERAW